MNIILVVIDTLRYDAVGANGGWIRTPHLDALAGRSWVFDRAFAASYPTIPHRTDVMTGRYGGPFHAWAPLRFDAATLPRALADGGYATQLIHDTPHLVNGGHNFDWPFHAWTFVHGAEVDRPWIDDRALTYLPNWAPDPLFDYVSDGDWPAPTDHTMVTYMRANRNRRRDEDWNAARLFAEAARFCRDNARRDNFFLWVDGFDPHEPWDAPPEFVRLYDDTDGYDGRIDPRALFAPGRSPSRSPDPVAVTRRLRAMYAGKVSWVDRCFGRLTDALAETGLAERTAIIVTADHGTNLGERGRFGKGWPIHETEAHVPLIVHVPGRGAGRCDAVVQPQDLVPTIAAIAGLDAPAGLDAHDVLAQAAGGERRRIALTGRHPCAWAQDLDAPLFTVFGDDAYLQWRPDPAEGRLFRYAQDVPLDDPPAEEVAELHATGLEEIARRGAPADLLAWLGAAGQGPPPASACANPAPAGYAQYWDRLYNRW